LKKHVHLYLLGFFLIFNATKNHAQLNAETTGSAQDLGNNCFQITPDQLDQAGGVFYNNPIDFANDFSIYYENNFGTKDLNGADGMALVFKPTSTADIGGIGGGLGYAGISNSLIVEFDTYWNDADNNDPYDDHIAIVSNGNPVHTASTNLAGPVQPTSTLINIEDGVDHNVKIVWTAATQTFEVFFDCELRLTLIQDIKNTIFGGDSSVFFGFVGSTGGLSNLHQVCFNRISFIDNFVLQDQTICEGESVQVDAEIPSGDTYSWSPSTGVSDISIANPIISPSTTTTYTVTIEDECGDAITESVEIIVTPKDPTVFNPISPICIGDPNPLPTSDTNGVTGTWSPAFDSNTTTTYTFTPDAGQCANSSDLEIIVLAETTTVFTPIADVCFGTSLTIPTTSNNGITGTWSPTFNPNTTTTYTFTPDVGQCASTADMTIGITPLTTPDFTPITDVCIGTSLTIPTTSNNGITGTWSPAFNPNTTTTYTFTPDAGQCASTAEMTIGITPLTTPDFTPIADVCIGTNITLPTSSNEGITGTWSPAFDPNSTTTYTFTPDTVQCATTAEMTIGITPLITPDFTAMADVCFGSSLTIPTTSNNGITGTWSPAFDPTTTTLYTFTPDPNQCADQTTMTIGIIPETTSTFNSITPVCEGTNIVLPTASNEGFTGTWSPAFDPNITTTYTFTPDAGQCASGTTLTVDIIPTVTPTFSPIDPICFGDAIGPLPTTSNNGINGTWTPATIDNTTTTTYTFTPNSGNCVENTTLEIIVLQQITPTFQIDDICIGETIPPLPNFSQEGISGTWSPAINNLATTTYTFTPDPGQCANPTTEIIEVNPINTLAITTENTSEPFNSNQIIEVTVTGGSGNYEYQLDGGNWQTSSMFQNVVGCQDHIVKVRDAEGCSNEPESTVTILSYPKFFTPNGDGFNDFWNIKCLRNNAGLVSIFDRFGKLLKQFKTTGSGWNGTYNNNLMPTSDYWFLVTYYDENGIKKEFRSHFTLRR